jgi:hypothetical protein
MDGIVRLPYRLPQVLARKAKGHTIFVPEGEKDADTLEALNLCATTNAGGAAWKYSPQFLEPFRGAKRIVLLTDCDDPGRKAALERAERLATVCDDIRIVDLAPNRKDGFDVSDWVAEGGTIEQLKGLVETAPVFGSSSQPDSPVSSPVSDDDAVAEMQTLDAADLLCQTYETPQFIVEHLIAERGVTLISADTGGGKSAFLMHASVALALDMLAADRFATTAAGRPVLYINGEMSPALLKQYLHQAVAAVGQSVPRGRIHFEGLDGLATFRFNDEDCARLERLVERIGPAVIVFDTMRALFEVDENDAGEVRRPFAVLLRLCQAHDCAAVVAHHVRKIGPVSNSDRERVSGSRDIIAAVDIHLVLKSRDGRPMHALKVDKTRFPLDGVAAGTEWPITARLEPGTPPRSIIIAAEPTSPEAAAEKVVDAEAAILDRLEAEGPLTIATLGADRGNTKRAFETLRKAGTIVVIGKIERKTLYGLPDQIDLTLTSAVSTDRARDLIRKKPSNDEETNAVNADRTRDRAGRSGDENASPGPSDGDRSSSSSSERGQRSEYIETADRDRTREKTGAEPIMGTKNGARVAEAKTPVAL